MNTPRFRRLSKLSSWRRLALHVWATPSDPTVYGNLEINMSQAVAYLAEANRDRETAPCTVTHLVIAAIAKALAESPESNAVVARRTIYLRDSVDIYCQVATEGGRDLSGVKLRDADRMSIGEIADALSQRVELVRTNRDAGSERSKQALASIPDRLLGIVLRLVGLLTYDFQLDLSRFGIAYDQFGGAMVSNVGNFGVGHGLAPLVPMSRTPIVLLVGAVHDKPAVVDGELAIAPQMTIGATFDHRVIDGYQASVMAETVIGSVTDPATAFGPPNRSSSTDDRPAPAQHETSDTDPNGNGYKDQAAQSPKPESPNARAAAS